MSTEVLALGIETAGYISGMKAATKITAGMQSAVTKLGVNLTRLGAGLTAAVTLPVTLMAKRSVASFIAFDKAIVNSQSIMQNVTADIDARMRNVATTISQQLPIAADKAAESFYFLASAGLDTEQSIAALPTVAKLATAGMFNLETATELLCDAQLALGETSADAETHVKNLARLADQLARGGDISSTSILQLSKALTNEAAAAMRNFKVATVDGIAVLSAYASQGIKGEEAGSMLARSIRLVTNAAVEHEAAWKKFGISAFDEKGNLQYVKVVNQLEKALGSLSTKQRSVALSELGFQALIQGAILPLMGASNQISKFRDELDNAGGTLDRTTNNQLKSFWSQLTILGNTVQNFGRSLAESLSMPMRALASIMQGIATAFTWIPGPMKTVIAIMGLLAAAFGPAVTAIGIGLLSLRAISVIGRNYIGIIGRLIGRLKEYAAGLRTVNEAQKLLTVTRYNDAIISFGNAFTPLTHSVNNSGRALLTYSGALTTTAKAHASSALATQSGILGYKVFTNAISPARKSQVGFVASLLSGVKAAGQWIKNLPVVSGLVKGLSLWIGIAGAIAGIASVGVGSLTAAVMSLWASLGPILPLVGAAAAVIASLYVVYEGLMLYADQLKASFATLWATITAVINNALEPFGVSLSDLGSTFSEIWNTILSVVGAVSATVITVVVALVVSVIESFNIMRTAIITVMQVIWTVIKTAWNIVWDITSSVMGWIWEKISAVWESIWGVIEPVVTAIVDFIKSAFNFVADIVVTVVRGIVKTLKWLLDQALSALKLIPGTSEVIDKITSATKKMGETDVGINIKQHWDKGKSDIKSTIEQAKEKLNSSTGNIGNSWKAAGDMWNTLMGQVSTGFKSPSAGKDKDTPIDPLTGKPTGKPGGLEERKYADLALEGSVEAYKSEIRRGGQASKKQETLLATIAKYTKQTASLAKDDSKNSIRLRTV